MADGLSSGAGPRNKFWRIWKAYMRIARPVRSAQVVLCSRDGHADALVRDKEA